MNDFARLPWLDKVELTAKATQVFVEEMVKRADHDPDAQRIMGHMLREATEGLVAAIGPAVILETIERAVTTAVRQHLELHGLQGGTRQ